MQDASAQMALLQFLLTKQPSAAVPTSIHSDHLITATSANSTSSTTDPFNHADNDVAASLTTHAEIYSFLSSIARKFNMDFWQPGAGIIHQVVLEQYAAPGLLLVGTDSHTPNAGGLGAMVSGIIIYDVQKGDWKFL